MKLINERYEELPLDDLDMVVGGAGRTLTPPPNPLGITNEGVLAGRDAFAADAAAHGGSAGVYVGFGSNALGNGPSSIMTLGSDGVHFYESQANGVGNGASAGGFVGVWGATSPNGSDYWTGPGTAGSVGFKEGGAAAVEFGYNSSGASAGISVGAGASLGGAAISASSTFGVEVHPGGETPQAGAPGSLADQAGINDIGSHPDAPGSLADQAGINDIGSHPDGGAALSGSGDQGGQDAGDHGAGQGAGADLGADLGGSLGVNDTGGSGHDSGGNYDGGNYGGGNNGGGNYGGDSNFGNDYGGGDFGGGDFGGSDFG